MENDVFRFDLNGQITLGFDTGLDSRAFAQAKFAQFITEPGLIVNNSVELWNATGVAESEERQTMIVYGPFFEGDSLFSQISGNHSPLNSIAAWIKALLFLADSPPPVPFQPLVVLIGKNDFDGKVFFIPPNLSMRCLKSGTAWYVHPDLEGINLAAFAAAALLYRIFSGEVPYPQKDELILRQDIREGNFLPMRFAVPSLDEKIASLIQSVLEPPDKKSGALNGKAVLAEFLAILQPALIDETQKIDVLPDNKNLTTTGLFKALSEETLLQIEKEKAQYLKVKTASVKTKRFVMRNTTLLLCFLAGIAACVLIAISIVNSRAMLPTTAGLDPEQVIRAYYYAMGDLDHQLMEACVIKNAGKSDIRLVINFVVVSKTRQAYEMFAPPLFISAKEWLDNGGGIVESGVFGVSDLDVKEQITNNREQSVQYQVNYTMWFPPQMMDDSDENNEYDRNRPPLSRRQSDLVTLILHKGNWRISEIDRSS